MKRSLEFQSKLETLGHRSNATNSKLDVESSVHGMNKLALEIVPGEGKNHKVSKMKVRKNTTSKMNMSSKTSIHILFQHRFTLNFH